jgi:uncharacterized Fe-S center protein
MERIIHEEVQNAMSTFMPDLNNFFERLENKQEKKLIELFNEIGILASVKTDKYSLPYQGEVVVKLHRESDINNMYLRSRIFRQMIKEMLDKNANKIRFYLHYETFYDGSFFGMGFKYSFRYYIH